MANRHKVPLAAPCITWLLHTGILTLVEAGANLSTLVKVMKGSVDLSKCVWIS